MAHKKSKLAMGSIEYGDIYNRLCQKDADGKRVPVIRDDKFVRDQKIGRLVVDFGNDEFWFRPIRGTARRLTMQDVMTLIANDLVEFDDPSSREPLLRYLKQYEQRAATLEEAEVRAVTSREKASELKADTKLQKSVRRNTRIAKMTWTLAMLGLVIIAVFATMPGAKPAKATSTIAGVGQEMDVDSSSIQQASYIQALGDGTNLYGVVTNALTKEVGDTSSGTGTVNENIVINPSASSEPTHMRPLYYDKTSFYQTEVTPDSSGSSKTAIYLQNPNGYALGVSANQLMLLTGSGMTSTALLTPTAYTSKTADETQSEIESDQNDAASEMTSSSSSSSDDSDAKGSGMPDGWLGVDHASIGSDRVAVSYWYTKGDTGKTSDLHRRIAILNIKDVLASGTSKVSDMDIAQINYQDEDSNFYQPEISQDGDSKGSLYLLAYMKQDYDGNTGFFVRRIQTDEDVLSESYTNTFSTEDLTGSTDPITNYRLLGNRLFFEQSGYIWMMNLSEAKLSVSINGDQRTINRENPIKICKSSDIYASITSDEKRSADETNASVSPVAHYIPMTLTTDDGTEYGIVFVESDTGDLVFQPAVDMTTASSGRASGTGADSTANGVGSGDAAAIAKLLAENAQNGDGYDQNMEGTSVNLPSDIIGKNATDAIKELQALHFNVKTTGGTGVVTSCSPSGSAAYGSTITLTLGQQSTSDSTSTSTQSSAATTGRYRQVDYTLSDGTVQQDDGSDSSDSSDGTGDASTDDSSSSDDATTDSSQSDDDMVTTVQTQNASNDTANASNANASNSNASNSNANGTGNGRTNAIANENKNVTSSMNIDVGNGRIAIRDVKKDHATIVCFAVRGEQIVWIEKDADSNKRHIKFSPIYYKESRSTVNAYKAEKKAENALKDANGNGWDASNSNDTVTTGSSDSVSAQDNANDDNANATDTTDAASTADGSQQQTDATEQQQQDGQTTEASGVTPDQTQQ